MRSFFVVLLVLCSGVMFAQVPANAPVSDDFSGSALNSSLWTFVNPRGDVTLSLTGTGTADARLVMAIPAGTIHDAWTGGVTAPRVMQAIANTDFEVDVRFDSPALAQYQIQGILVQQDATNFVRFDFVRDAAATRFFAATFVNDVSTVRASPAVSITAPFYLRVRRQGSQWTGSYSANGIAWTQAASFTHTLTVSSIGPWAGNAGSPAPAFTAMVDYFFSTASPIVPEDPTGGLIAPSITSQPAAQAVTVGQTATFAVVATGTAPLSYQWQKNAVSIVGATASSYTTPATVIGDNGAAYRCIVTNSVSSATSSAAIMTVSNVVVTGGANIITNGSFESGSSAWTFYTNGNGSFTTYAGGTDGTQAAKVAIAAEGTNVQLYHAQVPLQPNTAYQLSFDAFSTTAHDVTVMMGQHGAPFVNYGLTTPVDLGTSWQHYTLNFTSANFSTPVTDGRLSFWLAPYDANGDQYSFDNVALVRPSAANPGGAPAITTQPLSQTVTVGQTATFMVVATGSAPLGYQWQKNAVNISGATASTYTTAATVIGDNGATFRCVVTNSVNTATSSAGVLSVIPRVIGGTDIPFQHTIIDASGIPSTACKALGDLDGDGFIDITIASSTDATAGLVWYRYPRWEKYQVAQGIFTTEMKLADIDGDGDLDMVIPRGTYDVATMCWYENPLPARSPASGPWTMHVIGEEPGHDVATADIDKDGRMDVVVRDRFRTVVFFQTAKDTWTRKNISTRPSEGTSLGDLDNDGDLDVVINGYWLQNPLPLASPITGTWIERTIDATWPSFARTYTVDLNKDGRMDVILSVSESPNARFSWFESSTPVTGPWTEHIIDNTLSYLHCIAVADMDLDGSLDVITTEMHQSSDPDLVCVYRNAGNALTWTRQILATTGSHNMVVGDIGRDGDMDILGSNWQSTATNAAPTEIWENLLHAPATNLDSWSRHVIDANRPWRSMFITSADIDKDSRQDIIAGGWWYKNPGALTNPWVRTTIGSPLNNMAVVYDFDHDGSPDILGTKGVDANSSADFVWARNNGAGGFTILNNVASGEGDFLQGVAIGKFRHDTTVVALSWHEPGHGVQILTPPTNPSVGSWTWQRITTVSQHEQLSAADVDRDGDADLLMGTQWLRNDLTSWTPLTLNPTTAPPDRNRPGDFNHDGRMDVVVGFEATTGPSTLFWYEQPVNASSTWTEHIIATLRGGGMSVDVADMDGDGDLDVVVGEHHNPALGSERLLVYENLDGLGVRWAEHLVYTGDEHHDGAQLVDIDGDGDLDIISIGWTNTLVVLYENLAIHTSLSQASLPNTAPAQNEVAVAPEQSTPVTYSLSQNYPNPFNPTTMIRFGLPVASHVSLIVYNLIGQQIMQLVNGDLVAGFHEVRMSTSDRPDLPSGVYFYRIQAGSFSETRKLILLR